MLHHSPSHELNSSVLYLNLKVTCWSLTLGLFPLADETEGQSCVSDLFSDGRRVREKFRFACRQFNLRACCVSHYAVVFSTPDYPVLDNRWGISCFGLSLHWLIVYSMGPETLFHVLDLLVCFFIRWDVVSLAFRVLFPQFEDQKLTIHESWLWGWELFIPTFRRRSRVSLPMPVIFSKSCWICQGWCTIRVLLCLYFPRLEVDLTSTPIFPVPVLFLKDRLWSL